MRRASIAARFMLKPFGSRGFTSLAIWEQPGISGGFKPVAQIARCAGLARGCILTRVDDRKAT
jgi:hypothetical protein